MKSKVTVEIGDKIENLYIQDIYRKYFTNKKGQKRSELICTCLCDCGKTKDIRIREIKTDLAKSCGCRRYKTGKEHKGWKGYEEITGKYWSGLKAYAVRDNIFDLKIEDAWKLYLEQNKICAVTGKEIGFEQEYVDCTARIQRLDPHKSFCIENVRWVHKEVTKTPRAGANHKQWKGYAEIHGAFWGDICNSAKERNFAMEITIEQAWDLFIKQDRKCVLSGVDLFFYTHYKYKKTSPVEGTASLDRRDSSKGYTIDNVQWIHKDIQFMKMQTKEDKFINWCHVISKYQLDKEKSIQKV